MKKITISCSILTLLLLGSCTATHFGTFVGSTDFNPEHRNAGSVSGVASTGYLLGLGGFGKQALAAEARANMLTKFPMRDGLRLTNFTTDIKTSYILCFIKRTLILTADVIDLTQPTLPYGLKNGYFLNDSVFIELSTLQNMVSEKRLAETEIFPPGLRDNLLTMPDKNDSVNVFVLNKKIIKGKLFPSNLHYGVMVRTNIEGKVIYVCKQPSNYLFHL